MARKGSMADVNETTVKWGRAKDPHDVRDHIFRPRLAPSKMPDSVSLGLWQSPAYDQGDVGSCTGNAGAGSSALSYKKYFNLSYDPSRAFIDDKERIED